MAEYEGVFLNDGTAKIQEIHSENDVEIQELGLLSDNTLKVVLVGDVENINQILTVVDDPRNPPIDRE